MLINLQPLTMKGLAYSQTEIGRIEEVALTLFLEQFHPYWFVIADTDVLLRGYAMLYNTEKGDLSKAQIDIDALFAMLNKVKQKKYRPTDTEIAHTCNFLGLTVSKTKFYFLKRRDETIKKFLDDPSPFKYETERMPNLQYFLTWMYNKFQSWLGTFVPYMYTTDYVPAHYIKSQTPAGLSEQERHYWYVHKKREMMTNNAKKIAHDAYLLKKRLYKQNKNK